MALTLQLQDPIETDNYGNILEVLDNTGTGNTGWGTSGNPNYTSINGESNSADDLELGLTIEIRKSTEDDYTAYDEIDFYTHNNNTTPVNITDLVFNLTPADLINGVPLGASTDLFPEGMYKFTYELRYAQSSVVIDTLEVYELIDYAVKTEVYQELAEVPDAILNLDNPSTQDWEVANRNLSYFSYWQGMRADLSLAEIDRVLRQLYVLQTKLL